MTPEYKVMLAQVVPGTDPRHIEALLQVRQKVVRLPGRAGAYSVTVASLAPYANGRECLT